MRCSKCDKPINGSGADHFFSGYGWAAEYCPECCPVEMDGTFCRAEHPTAEQQTLQEQLLKEEEEADDPP